ncbi:MAG TPA: LysM peptidoglycan-binding domain-containing protein, partial [Dongiaceae bacterium]
MRSRSKPSILLAALLLLAACNQSGRPANVPEPVDKPVARILPSKDMGQTVGGQYVVAPGDTLAAVAERTNTPIRTLIDMNHLQPPYAMTPGMRLSLQQRSQYVVQSGDTLPDLAQRFGVTESSLVAINNLQTPYKLKAGQALNLPSTTEASNLVSASASAVPPPTPVGGVSQGALVAPTAGTSAVSASALPPPSASLPATPAPSTLTSKAVAPATTLPPVQAPAALPTATIPAPATTIPTVAAETKSAAQTAAKAATVPAMPATPAAPVAAAANAASAAQTNVQSDAQSEISQGLAMEKAPAAGSGKGPFAWPVQGKVINAFGSSTDGMKNDGINIAAPAGSPVVASADGVVAYAGNELRGF